MTYVYIEGSQRVLWYNALTGICIQMFLNRSRTFVAFESKCTLVQVDSHSRLFLFWMSWLVAINERTTIHDLFWTFFSVLHGWFVVMVGMAFVLCSLLLESTIVRVLFCFVAVF